MKRRLLALGLLGSALYAGLVSAGGLVDDVFSTKERPQATTLVEVDAILDRHLPVGMKKSAATSLLTDAGFRVKNRTTPDPHLVGCQNCNGATLTARRDPSLLGSLMLVFGPTYSIVVVVAFKNEQVALVRGWIVMNYI